MHALGWHAEIGLEAGIAATYDWYLKNPSQPHLHPAPGSTARRP
jgi:dTDP-D-glucose 4,6-dehydratase